jgi:hypothetical protein
MSDCKVVLRESVTVFLAVISAVIRDNSMVLLIAALIVAGTAAVVFYLCKQVWNVVVTWRRLKPTET